VILDYFDKLFVGVFPLVRHPYLEDFSLKRFLPFLFSEFLRAAKSNVHLAFVTPMEAEAMIYRNVAVP
jgi:hypothetical protein